MSGIVDHEPLLYHRAVVNFLRSEAPALWSWHATSQMSSQRSEAIRLELLKSTYRLDREAHAALYQHADAAAQALGLEVAITCYQTQVMGNGQNAALWYLPGEAHVVLQGPIQATLTEPELASVIAHELGHYALWSKDVGVYGTADRILTAMAEHPRAEPCHLQTRRRWHLATEIYADRAALLACGDLGVAVSALVRIETGAPTVDANACLAQAHEILSIGIDKSTGASHPECFIRAVALAAFAHGEPGAEARIERLLNGGLDPHELDVLDQRTCAELTRTLLGAILEPVWMRTDGVVAHARLFFHDIIPGAAAAELDRALKEGGASLRDYVCAVLVDFAAADRALEDVGVAHGFLLAERWGWGDRFAELCHRDLKLKVKDLGRIREQAAQLCRAASESGDKP